MAGSRVRGFLHFEACPIARVLGEDVSPLVHACAHRSLATPGVADAARQTEIRSALETPSLRPRSRTTCPPTRSLNTAKLSWVARALIRMVIAIVTATSRTINP